MADITMKPRLLRIFLPLLTVSLAVSARGESPAPPEELDTTQAAQILKFDMKVGKTFDTDMVVSQTMSMMGQDIVSKIMMGVQMAVEEGGSDAAKKVVTSYTRTGIDMNMMGQAIRYDSADEDADPSNPLAIMGSIVGKKITMLLDESNLVTGVEGVEDLKATLGGDPATAGQLDAFLNEDQLKQMSNAWINEVLPPDPVAAGDSWPFSYSMTAAGVGEITYKGTAKLLGHTTIDGIDVGVLDLDGAVDMEMTDGETAGQMAALGLKLTGGKSRSIVYWDNDLGYLRKMDAVQEMNMSMKNPQTGEDMTMPIKQDISLKVGVK